MEEDPRYVCRLSAVFFKDLYYVEVVAVCFVILHSSSHLSVITKCVINISVKSILEALDVVGSECQCYSVTDLLQLLDL